jgi:hypothetical protein
MALLVSRLYILSIKGQKITHFFLRAELRVALICRKSSGYYVDARSNRGIIMKNL